MLQTSYYINKNFEFYGIWTSQQFIKSEKLQYIKLYKYYIQYVNDSYCFTHEYL